MDETGSEGMTSIRNLSPVNRNHCFGVDIQLFVSETRFELMISIQHPLVAKWCANGMLD